MKNGAASKKTLSNPYIRQAEIVKEIRDSKLFGIERYFSIFLALFLMAMPGQ
jgi:hypothetical protein